MKYVIYFGGKASVNNQAVIDFFEEDPSIIKVENIEIISTESVEERMVTERRLNSA